MIKLIRYCGFCLLILVFMVINQVQAQGQQQHGNYTVYHTIFDSTFLQPDIAAAYGVVRGEDLFLVNISVNVDGKNFGQAVNLKGTATNLLQQQKTLDFKTISEGEATYYIAPLRVTSQDILHFAIDVRPPEGAPFTVKFSRTLRSQ
jgi:hypothetical protein